MVGTRIILVTQLPTFSRSLPEQALQRFRLVVGFVRNASTQQPAKRTKDDSTTTTTSTRLYQIKWTTKGGVQVWSAADGELLRTAALRRGVSSPHNGLANNVNCRGLGTCGTCAVEIEGWVEPLIRTTAERMRLAMPPGHGASSIENPRLRLACQVRVRGDLHVTKRTGLWGQYRELADPSPPTRPLGEFEFVMDAQSTPPPPQSSKSSSSS